MAWLGADVAKVENPKGGDQGRLASSEDGVTDAYYFLIFNAKRCPVPSVPKDEKHGWWAAEGYIWAFYDTALFTKQAVPEAIEGLKRVDEKIRAGIIRKLSPLVGKRVVITGTSREDLNGRAGLARSFDQSKARYVVRLEDGLDLKVKPADLEEEEE